jgi:hypothetical protein
LSGSRVSLSLLGDRQVLERSAQAYTVDGLFDDELATAIDLVDETLAVGVDDEAEKIRTHVMTTL